MENNKKRRFAAHMAILPDGEKMPLAVVEVVGDIVSSIFRLKSEIPSTEWIGGSIELKCSDDGRVFAFKDGEILNKEYKKRN